MSRIDRRSLVRRHNVTLTAPEVWSPLSVGNGAFCFSADITGLQTFGEEYEAGVPLGTMADWSWHSFSNPERFHLEQTLVEVAGAGGRRATYPLETQSPAAQWLRANPHQFSLGQIGLKLNGSGGARARLDELTEIEQTLDLWTGLLASRFVLDGEQVTVLTACQGEADAIAVRVESTLVAADVLTVCIAFPYPSGVFAKGFNRWDCAERHHTEIVAAERQRFLLRRSLDGTTYGCTIAAENGRIEAREEHHFEILPDSGDNCLEFVVAFSEREAPALPVDFAAARAAAAAAMCRFWMSGGAIDLSQSTDTRWRELERRIVLSQYLTGIQSRGRTCPQETGLTCNSWHGKFHLEMHWWHAVHFALWGRREILARQFEWFLETLSVAQATAKRQGYAGARWGKMVGPDGRESPSGVGPLLLWQQPHPIYYAELLYRLQPEAELLEKYACVVDQTAAFMADFACWNEERSCFELGPPFISAREQGSRSFAQNKNGAFELAYWRWGLHKANEWRHRLGQAKNRRWDEVADKLAPLPINDGVYTEQEQELVEDSGHPCPLAAWGFLPRMPVVDEERMAATLAHVLNNWDFEDTWGWDYPMMAFTAARLGRGEWAIQSLLLEATANTYRASGHNYQTENLPLYLPGNGGLLAAVAMMAAGWDGAPDREAPGFPDDGWVVLHEGLSPMP